jgi:hypothetical protein
VQQKKRNLASHSLMHTFVTLARLAGIPDIEIRALSGHKDAAVMGKYFHVSHVIDSDEARKKIEMSISVKNKQEIAEMKTVTNGEGYMDKRG